MPRVGIMPSTAYARTIWTIRDYPRLLYEIEQLRKDLEGAKATNYNETPKGHAKDTDERWIRLADMQSELDKIQECIDTIPKDMRNGIVNNVIYGSRFPVNEWGQLVPSLRQWQREKSRFIVLVAHKLGIYKK